MSVSHSRIAMITFNDVPKINTSLKYGVLGVLAVENHRRYCSRHGYDFISEVPIARDRPACWAKIPAILAAFEDHEWVLWADSDTLIFDRRPLDRFLDPAHDMIVQSHDAFFRLIGMPIERGMARMPINTGVFLMRRSAWSRGFLERAYAQTGFVSHGAVWDGIGEQEAMIAVLNDTPSHRARIGHVDGLQNHPLLYRPGDMFVHFYGNHARHRIPADESAEVVARWQDAVMNDRPLPRDIARFHWCCIQNVSPDEPIRRGDLDHFLYRPEDIAGAAADLATEYRYA